eukprot:scaffold1369_cov396-Prasinococcus_capsulatus_cf.AAC.3
MGATGLGRTAHPPRLRPARAMLARDCIDDRPGPGPPNMRPPRSRLDLPDVLNNTLRHAHRTTRADSLQRLGGCYCLVGATAGWFRPLHSYSECANLRHNAEEGSDSHRGEGRPQAPLQNQSVGEGLG